MKKLYKQEKELQDFLPNSFNCGVVITKGDKVLFAKNYKSMKQTENAYDTICEAHEIFGVEPDNKTTIRMWNGQWFFNEKCFITKEFSKKCDDFHKKWFEFTDKRIKDENRKKIKEVRFNTKNYELMSYKTDGLGYLNGYKVVIDDTVTEDFKVIYESENK